MLYFIILFYFYVNIQFYILDSEEVWHYLL